MDPNSAVNRREILQGAAAVAVAGVLSFPTHAQVPPAMSLSPVAPHEIGLDADQLDCAYKLLTEWTEGPKPPIVGASMLVGRNGRIVSPRYFGHQQPGEHATVIGEESRFLMASITKPMTYIAAMRQVEQGRLNLTDTVSRYLPEFKGDGKDAVLVRHLFTHTSGLPDMPPGNDDLRRRHAPFAKFVEAAIRDTTLLFAPGTQVSYQSCGTILVAEIVQRLTGRPIADVLQEQIFTPLGMSRTTLGARGVPAKHFVDAEEPAVAKRTDFGWDSDYWRAFGAPWGGMYSTATDFARICLMLLGGGTWNGAGILSRASVRAMTTNRLLEDPKLPEVVARTEAWGLGLQLNHAGQPESWGDLLGKNTFGHTGSTGTMFWVDPDTQTFCILLTNAVRAKAPWRLVHLSNAVAAAIL